MTGIVRSPSAAVAALRAARDFSPQLAIILGSGLGPVAALVTDAVVVEYRDLPNMPVSHVPGHAGRVLLGHVRDLPVVVFSGRVHLYEGWEPTDVTFPVDVAAELGVETLVVTNAAGGVNLDFAVGRLMLITDHLNLLGVDPMRGTLPQQERSPFVPMAGVYSASLRDVALRVGRDAGLDLATGVYAATPGPTYETAAEVRMLRAVGADAVGMSTVPEVIRAAWHGMDVLGISAITNRAPAVRGQDHQDVARIAAAAAEPMAIIVAGVCEHLH